MCVMSEIDVDDWRRNTAYRNGYSNNHKVIEWFWRAVTSFDHEKRARLLQFATGTSHVPAGGFSELYGNSGPSKFCIDYLDNPSALPRAHTWYVCAYVRIMHSFNRIDLPKYSTYEELVNKLTMAIDETSTFAID